MTVVVIVLFCGVGLAAALSPAVDAWLSVFFTWVFAVAGGGGVLVWLLREAWDAVEDRRVMGPPDLGLLRRRRKKPEREEVAHP